MNIQRARKNEREKRVSNNFMNQEFLQEAVQSSQLDCARLNQKAPELREESKVRFKESSEGSFLDAEGGQVGQEIIPDKVSEQDEIIEEALEIELKGGSLFVQRETRESRGFKFVITPSGQWRFGTQSG